MASNATGALTRIVGATQTALREIPAAPEAEVLYVSGFDFNDAQPPEQDPTLAGGYRGELKGLRGRVDATGSANVVLGTSIGFWLKHLVGAPTTTGAGPYVHTFRVGAGANALPAAALFERDFGERIAGAGRRVRNADVRIGTAAFAFNTSSATQTATFNLVGASRRTRPAEPVDDTPADYGHAAFGLQSVSLVLDDGATEMCIETLNLNWDNDLDTDAYCLNDGGQRHSLDEGAIQLTGDGVGQFDTAALMDKAEADASLKLQITLRRGNGSGSAGNERLVITIPLTTLEAPTPAVNGPRGLRQNFSFRAYREGGAELGVTAVLYSPRAVI